MTADPHPCANRSVLVVEDEAVISMLIEDMLGELGCGDIRCVGTLKAGLAAIEAKHPDLVILDVNLGGTPAFPIAERLAAAGVPFLFTTGYGAAGLPPEWAGRPVLQKPFSVEALAAQLRQPDLSR